MKVLTISKNISSLNSSLVRAPSNLGAPNAGGVYRVGVGSGNAFSPRALSADGRTVLDSLGRVYKSPSTVAYELGQSKKSSLPNVPSSVGTFGNLVKVGNGLALVLSAPQVAKDFGEGLGYLANLPQNISNELEKNRLDKALKQREAAAATAARINNAVPSSSLGTGLLPSQATLDRLRNESGGFEALRNDDVWVGEGSRPFTGAEVADLPFYASDQEAIASGWALQIGLSLVARTYFKAVRPLNGIPIGSPVNGPNLSPPPVYPSFDDLYTLDDFDFDNPNGLGDANNPMPIVNQKPKSFGLPSPLPSPNSSGNTGGQPQLQRSPSGQPIIGSPTFAPSPSANAVNTSFAKPAFQARPFISGQSDPSELQNPRDVTTGLTRQELEEQYKQQQQAVQDRAKANQRAAAAADAKAVQEQLNNLPNSPRSDLGGKSPRQVATENYLNQIKGNTIREDAFRQLDNSPKNTTPTTPKTQPQTTNNLELAGQIAAALAAITALKVGSDLLVNNSLNNTPKINQIANNTTPAAQQTNAKQGVCDAMQPDQCGYQGVQQATKPIADGVAANAGTLANILSAIANLANLISQLFQNLAKPINAILNNQFVHGALTALTTFTTIHNAAMLSRDIGETLGGAIDNGLNLFGQVFKDGEGNTVTFSNFIGTNARALIVNIVGEERYLDLVSNWQKANTIYHSAVGVLNTTQSMLDPISTAVEYGMENVSKIGNSLKDDGVVAENAYPAMDETIRARRVNRFERLNDTLEGAENIVSNLSSVTSSAVSVKEDFKQLREDTKQFKDKVTEFSEEDIEAREALKAELPKEITSITLAPAPEEEEESTNE